MSNAFNDTFTKHYAHECSNKVSINMCDNEESPFKKPYPTDLVHQKSCLMDVQWAQKCLLHPSTHNTHIQTRMVRVFGSTVEAIWSHSVMLHVQKIVTKNSHLNLLFMICAFVVVFFFFIFLFFFNFAFSIKMFSHMGMQKQKTKKHTCTSHPGSD